MEQDELIDNPDFVRQLDIYNPDKDPNPVVTIIGAGGTGTPIGIALTKLGIQQVNFIDHDVVESHNTTTQFYPRAFIGKPKVVSIVSLCRYLAPSKFGSEYSRNAKCEDLNMILGEIIIVAVDNMATRKYLWENRAKMPHANLYIDVRLGGNVVKVYMIETADETLHKAYSKTLHSDEESAPVPCTQQGAIDMGFATAFIVTRQIRRYLKTGEIVFNTVFDEENLEFLTFGSKIGRSNGNS